jgi:hypothetical protein
VSSRAIAIQGGARPNGVLVTDSAGRVKVVPIGDGLELDGTLTASGTTPPPSSGSTFNTFLISGGQVVWESGFTFRVSAASYQINGTRYDSAEQTITLDAADPSDPRIDVIVLDTTGTVDKVTGTAAAAASEPTVDPASYVKLAIVSVPAGATAPAGATTVTLYTDNAGAPTEWNWTASGASLNVNSTTNPHTGTKTIEGTNVAAGVYARGTIGSGSIEPNDYDALVFFIRSKGAWNTSRGLLVSFRASGTLVGATVQIRRTGTYGFDSTVTTAYQQVAIPVSAFAIPLGTTATQIQVEDFGGAIGFYIDNVSLQVGASTSAPGGITEAEADARYAPLIHASRHKSGGADPIRLDELAAPTDVTTLNASTSAHGLLPKLDNNTAHFLRGDGTWAAPAGGAGTSTLLFQIDGAGAAAITTGFKGVSAPMPRAGTITKWWVFSADPSITTGSIVFDIWKDTAPNYPPTIADTITASAKPTLSSGVQASSSTLTGWTTSFSAGDVFGITVDSITSLTRAYLVLEVTW